MKRLLLITLLCATAGLRSYHPVTYKFDCYDISNTLIATYTSQHSYFETTKVPGGKAVQARISRCTMSAFWSTKYMSLFNKNLYTGDRLYKNVPIWKKFKILKFLPKSILHAFALKNANQPLLFI